MTDEEFRALVLEAFKLQPTGDYHYPFAPNQLRHLVARAGEAEREACAKVCHEVACGPSMMIEERHTAKECERKIRARGSK
jgi:hypothetical protein